MMRIQVYILKKKADKTYKAAMGEYLKRLSAYAKLSVSYVKKVNEKDLIGEVFYVCSGNQTKSSPEFAKELEHMPIKGVSTITFIVGDIFLEDMEELNLSTFSFDVEMTGVVLLEQLYRAYRIIHNQPYHK